MSQPGVYNAEIDLAATSESTQTIVADEVRVIAFQLTELQLLPIKEDSKKG